MGPVYCLSASIEGEKQLQRSTWLHEMLPLLDVNRVSLCVCVYVPTYNQTLLSNRKGPFLLVWLGTRSLLLLHLLFLSKLLHVLRDTSRGRKRERYQKKGGGFKKNSYYVRNGYIGTDKKTLEPDHFSSFALGHRTPTCSRAITSLCYCIC